MPRPASTAMIRAEARQEAAEEPTAGYGPSAPPREGVHGALEGLRFVRSEPIVLAKHVGQVVVVMEAERTSRTALEEAIGLIGTDCIAGVVLNKAPRIIGHEGFGQGYNYGYYYGS